MKAWDIHAHFMREGEWVNWDDTCDTFIVGDPEKEVKTLGVVWMGTWELIKKVVEEGFDMLIVHEPVFYGLADPAEEALAKEKHEFIKESGLVIYRSHDFWDRYPNIGVQDAWVNLLELGEKIVDVGWGGVHRTRRTTLDEFAEHVASKLKRFGQDCIRVLGESSSLIERVGVGIGFCGHFSWLSRLKEEGADVVIVTEPIFWRDVPWAQDAGLPLIFCDHATAEEPALEKLTEYLQEIFPELTVKFFLSQKPRFLCR